MIFCHEGSEPKPIQSLLWAIEQSDITVIKQLLKNADDKRKILIDLKRMKDADIILHKINTIAQDIKSTLGADNDNLTLR